MPTTPTVGDPRTRTRVRDVARGWRGALVGLVGLLGVALLLGAPTAGFASASSQMRQARFALVRGDEATARRALENVRGDTPASARGIEASVLLADLHFSKGRTSEASKVLSEAAAVASGHPATAVALARGWLEVSHGTPQKAREHFRMAGQSPSAFARAFAQVGQAWAALAAGQPIENAAALEDIARRGQPPALRFAAGWTLARAYSSQGDGKRALRELRRLRRGLRHTTYEDDSELALGLAQLESGRVRQARRTFRRLERRFGPPRDGVMRGHTLEIRDLRDSHAGLIARISDLYASRSNHAMGLLAFLASLLDRHAVDDVPGAQALTEAALAGAMAVRR